MVKIGHYEVRQDYLYYDNYIWIDRISDNELLIGISDYAQQMLKDITSIMPPSNGQRFVSGSELLSIESISREFSLKSPVSCVIQEINQSIVTSPDSLNKTPFDSWIVRVEVLDLGDMDKLIDGEEMADNILDEVGMENRATDSSTSDFDDDEDFDYESEFSIDSGESYDFYQDEYSSKSNDEETLEEFEEDW
ncbi:MAG: glycine cleavage system protein H [Candidatus Kariarchaeaceae archaeon]|jgi:glycine cleavage system H protein